MIEANIGDRVKLVATFKDDVGNVSDPTLVTGSVLRPDRVRVSSDVSKLGIGVYALEVDVDLNGIYYAKFFGTGALKAATEDIEISASSRFG